MIIYGYCHFFLSKQSKWVPSCYLPDAILSRKQLPEFPQLKFLCTTMSLYLLGPSPVFSQLANELKCNRINCAFQYLLGIKKLRKVRD